MIAVLLSRCCVCRTSWLELLQQPDIAVEASIKPELSVQQVMAKQFHARALL